MTDLLTLTEVRVMDVWNTLTTYTDLQVNAAIDDISAMICAIVNHEFPYQPSTTITILGDGTDTLSFLGLIPLAGLPATIDATAYDPATHHLLPVSGPPYHRIRLISGSWFEENDPIPVVGDWGWATIPTDVKRAAFACISRYLVDESYRGQVTGSTAASGDLSKVEIGEGKAAVTFAPSSEASTIVSSNSTGIPFADTILERYVLRQTAFSV